MLARSTLLEGPRNEHQAAFISPWKENHLPRYFKNRNITFLDLDINNQSCLSQLGIGY